MTHRRIKPLILSSPSSFLSPSSPSYSSTSSSTSSSSSSSSSSPLSSSAFSPSLSFRFPFKSLYTNHFGVFVLFILFFLLSGTSANSIKEHSSFTGRFLTKYCSASPSVSEFCNDIEARNIVIVPTSIPTSDGSESLGQHTSATVTTNISGSGTTGIHTGQTTVQTTGATTGATNAHASSSAGSSGSSQNATMASNGTATTSSSPAETTPHYMLDLEPSSGNNLKYLYLIFLFIAVVIAVVVGRIIFVKRRRAKKMEKAAFNRQQALRMDMEISRSGDLANQDQNPGPPVNPEMEEIWNPPPPYPTHVVASEHSSSSHHVDSAAESSWQNSDSTPSNLYNSRPHARNVTPRFNSSLRDPQLPIYGDIPEQDVTSQSETFSVSTSQRHLQSSNHLTSPLNSDSSRTHSEPRASQESQV